MSKRYSLALSLTAATSLAACANTSGSKSATCAALTTSDAKPSADWKGTVFTIVMENHSFGQIVGNTKEAPFLNSLIKQNALAAGYHDSYVHPSEPNYFEMVAGENFGILNDNDPGASNHISSTSHIADQLEKAGLTWKAYAESMGAPCGLSSNGNYATKHVPFVYFDDIAGWNGSKMMGSARCTQHVVDYTQLDADLKSGNMPRYAFITPNMINDMHNGSTADGDNWLSREVPKILSSDAFNNGGVLFILWDEGGGYPQSDDPPFIAISPHAKPGFVSHQDYDTSSYLKTVQMILGVDSLPCDSAGATVQPMSDLFQVPLNASTTSTPDGGTPPATGTAAPATGATAPTTGTAAAPGSSTVGVGLGYSSSTAAGVSVTTPNGQ
jgi:acid phosphatase